MGVLHIIHWLGIAMFLLFDGLNGNRGMEFSSLAFIHTLYIYTIRCGGEIEGIYGLIANFTTGSHPRLRVFPYIFSSH